MGEGEEQEQGCEYKVEHVRSEDIDDAMEKVKVVVMDYYMCPLGECLPRDRMKKHIGGCCEVLNWSRGKVPVIRVYGCTPGGQKICLHVHQVYPYFYVRYDDDLPDENLDQGRGNAEFVIVELRLWEVCCCLFTSLAASILNL